MKIPKFLALLRNQKKGIMLKNVSITAFGN